MNGVESCRPGRCIYTRFLEYACLVRVLFVQFENLRGVCRDPLTVEISPTTEIDEYVRVLSKGPTNETIDAADQVLDATTAVVLDEYPDLSAKARECKYISSDTTELPLTSRVVEMDQ